MTNVVANAAINATANALEASVQSMQHDLHRMETISQNMVNMATPGYKRAIPSAQTFDASLRAAGSTQSPGSHSVLSGVMLQGVVDLTTGPMKQTNRAGDVAISGDGYFEFVTPEGPAYGRAGDFQLDAAGRLVSSGGFPVQGLSGDIQLRGADFSIDSTGHVLQNGDVVGQIKVVQFEDPKALVKTGTGLLRPRDSGNRVIEKVAELQAGYLESSNVAPMREMIAMLETTRHFESAQKLFQGYDEALGNAIRKLGEF